MVDTAVILLVEDDEDDALLLRRAFKAANLLNPLYVVHDGIEAISYLKGEGAYANRDEYPLPALVLLDLNMPGKNGFQVLKWIRQQPGLRGLRIVVLTGCSRAQDVNLAHLLGANSFLVKPGDFGQFVDIVRALQGYWLWMSEAPETFRPPPKPRTNPPS